MNNSVKRRSLDLQKQGIQWSCVCQQYDTNTRQFELSIYDNGKVFDLDDISATLYCYLPNSITTTDSTGEEVETQYVMENCTIEDGYILVTLSTLTLSQVGTIKCQLKLTGTGNTEQVISCPMFAIEVEEVIDNDSVPVSSSYLSKFDTIINEMSNLDIDVTETKITTTTPNTYEVTFTKTNKDGTETTTTFTLSDGEKGDKGEQGVQGIQGIQGVQGEKGEKGDTGAKGDKGEQGEQGVQGIQGIQGIQGEKGEKGDKGDKGDAGTSSFITLDMTSHLSESTYLDVTTLSQGAYQISVPDKENDVAYLGISADAYVQLIQDDIVFYDGQTLSFVSGYNNNPCGYISDVTNEEEYEDCVYYSGFDMNTQGIARFGTFHKIELGTSSAKSVSLTDLFTESGLYVATGGGYAQLTNGDTLGERHRFYGCTCFFVEKNRSTRHNAFWFDTTGAGIVDYTDTDYVWDDNAFASFTDVADMIDDSSSGSDGTTYSSNKINELVPTISQGYNHYLGTYATFLTGVPISSDYQIEITFNNDTYQNNGAVFGNSAGARYMHLTMYDNKWYTSSGSTETNFSADTTGKHTFIMNKDNGNYFDGTKVTDYSPYDRSGTYLWIGGRNDAVNCVCDIYEFKVTSNSTSEVLFDFIPTKININGTIICGYSDSVSGAFVSSNGEFTFKEITE